MIERFTAKNYGCLRDVSLGLTPFHALIGPNDSGKSTILRGIRTLGQFVVGGFHRRQSPPHEWQPFDPGLPMSGEAIHKTLAEIELGITSPAGTAGMTIQQGGVDFWRVVDSKRQPTQPLNWRFALVQNSPWSAIGGATQSRLVRLDPDALRQQSGLVPHGADVSFLDERGKGLPGVIQSIQGRYFDRFQTINEQVREFFPTIKYVQVIATSPATLVIEAELADGTHAPADLVSEGLLYFLAFASIPYLAPTPILLVEEPENGLHPSRIATVIKMLREFGKRSGTQIILATHSPLVVNELEPDEVTIVTRPSVETGTVVTPMTKTRNFEKRKTAYALGELWLSYADGNFESELVELPKT